MNLLQTDKGEEIELSGHSGQRYYGKIYAAKDSVSSLQGEAIACLTNSEYTETGWMHQVNSIYNTNNADKELARLGERDDISHLILLPYSSNNNGVSDKVDDLIRSCIHR